MKTITLKKITAKKGWLPIGARYTYSYKTNDDRGGMERARAALIRDTRGTDAGDVEDPITDWSRVDTQPTDLRHGDQRRVLVPDLPTNESRAA